jgi:hypothetical protein
MCDKTGAVLILYPFQRHRQTPFSQIQVSARAKTRASTSIILRVIFGEISGTRIKKSTLPYVVMSISSFQSVV